MLLKTQVKIIKLATELAQSTEWDQDLFFELKEAVEHTELVKEMADRFGGMDLDCHVEELKAQEAKDINNAGFEDQVRYLIERGGEDWVRDTLLDDPVAEGGGQ
jgi:hypothetical protein